MQQIELQNEQEAESNEWYSPSNLVEDCRDVMGEITLDPASCITAQQVIKAKHYYTKEMNGLLLPWFGSIFLNPPYSAKLIKEFTQKVVNTIQGDEFDNICILTRSSCETSWFKALSYACDFACYLDKRVVFWNPNKIIVNKKTGKKTDKQTDLSGHVLFFAGYAKEDFYSKFCDQGMIHDKPLNKFRKVKIFV